MKKPYAFTKAKNFLHNAIQRGLLQEGAILPTVRTLAIAAGVSRSVMWKAIRELISNNVLVQLSRHTFSIGAKTANTDSHGHPPASADLPAGCLAWEKVRYRMLRDFLSGSWLPGQLLPSLKELCSKYGTSYPSLRRALDTLITDSYIEPYKRTYIFKTSSNRHLGRSRILILTLCNSDGTPFLNTNRHEEFMRVLEKEARHRNFGFDVKLYTPSGKEFLIVEPDTAQPVTIKSLEQARYIGYIVLKIMNFFVDRNPAFHSFICNTLGPLGMPVAIIDDSEPAPLPPSKYSYIKLFSLGLSKECGREVGQLLINLGHRHVVYLSLYHKNDWSKNRLAGLVEAYNSAGISKAVTAITSEDYINQFYLAAKAPPSYPAELTSIKQTINKYINASEPLATLARKVEIEFWKQEIIGREWLCIQPLLKKALEVRNATAWVCANDNLANRAIEFLHKSKVKVPQDVSVVGFDDLAEAYTHNLTSYNFNVSGAAHTMINYVLAPKAFCGHWDQKHIPIHGMIIERGTTAQRNLSIKNETVGDW